MSTNDVSLKRARPDTNASFTIDNTKRSRDENSEIFLPNEIWDQICLFADAAAIPALSQVDQRLYQIIKSNTLLNIKRLGLFHYCQCKDGTFELSFNAHINYFENSPEILKKVIAVLNNCSDNESLNMHIIKLSLTALERLQSAGLRRLHPQRLSLKGPADNWTGSLLRIRPSDNKIFQLRQAILPSSFSSYDLQPPVDHPTPNDDYYSEIDLLQNTLKEYSDAQLLEQLKRGPNGESWPALPLYSKLICPSQPVNDLTLSRYAISAPCANRIASKIVLNRKFEKLKLDKLSLDQEALVKIAEGIRYSTIKQLSIHLPKCSPESMQKFLEQALQAPSLTHLKIYCTDLNEAALLAIAKYNLSEITIDRLMRDPNFSEFIENLQGSQLAKLRLSNCCLNDSHIPAMIAKLNKLAKLEELDLSTNNFTDQGRLNDFCQAAATLPYLKMLNMYNERRLVQGEFDWLDHYLQSHLTTVGDSEGNLCLFRDMSDDILETILNKLQGKTVKYLTLDVTDGTENEQQALDADFLSLLAFYLDGIQIENLEINTKFEECDATIKALQDINKALKDQNNIRNINLYNASSFKFTSYLLDMLKGVTCRELDLSEIFDDESATDNDIKECVDAIIDLFDSAEIDSAEIGQVYMWNHKSIDFNQHKRIIDAVVSSENPKSFYYDDKDQEVIQYIKTLDNPRITTSPLAAENALAKFDRGRNFEKIRGLHLASDFTQIDSAIKR